ncbi:GIY-YIG nuclease family protein [Candidatus Uhrbacteria bacterium]|nr:GIY-YIG nuclease family protein [Candidatus Uhrbacteria bacterium]
MFYLYLLLLSNKDLYKGSTADLKQRVQQHQDGAVQSTRNYRPVRLIHYECYIKKSDALRRERFLKTTEGKRFLRQQIRDLLSELS